MALVRSHDLYTGVEIKREAAWGTDPGTWGTASYRVPFTGEDLHYERTELPISEEFTSLGGVTGVDFGLSVVRGAINLEPSYNGRFFWELFGSCFGSENLILDRACWDDTTAATNLNTHIFSYGTGYTSYAARIFKSGPSKSASTWLDTVLGLKAASWTWDHPEGNRPKVTINYLGKSIVTTTSSAESLPASPTHVKVKATDLIKTSEPSGHPDAYILTGATPTALNLTSFNVTVDRKLEAQAAFLPSLLTQSEPGIEGTREVTLTLTSLLEQDYNADFRPWKEFLATTLSSVVIQYQSSTDTGVGTGNYYTIRFEFPNVYWTDVRQSISRSGSQQMTMTAKAIVGPLATLGTWDPGHTNEDFDTVAATSDMRVLMHCTGSAGDDVDTKWTALGDFS